MASSKRDRTQGKRERHSTKAKSHSLSAVDSDAQDTTSSSAWKTFSGNAAPILIGLVIFVPWSLSAYQEGTIFPILLGAGIVVFLGIRWLRGKLATRFENLAFLQSKEATIIFAVLSFAPAVIELILYAMWLAGGWISEWSWDEFFAFFGLFVLPFAVGGGVGALIRHFLNKKPPSKLATESELATLFFWIVSVSGIALPLFLGFRGTLRAEVVFAIIVASVGTIAFGLLFPFGDSSSGGSSSSRGSSSNDSSWSSSNGSSRSGGWFNSSGGSRGGGGGGRFGSSGSHRGGGGGGRF
ncbi:MAG: hypothetical protein LBM23_02175 [Propionibacteriaceae bacterium]|jgi:hypothetical protein|nr:hypothetical protein [Propionibacteriaceae bacterium]